MEMMDREKAYIPKLQIAFLDSIALPLFRYCCKKGVKVMWVFLMKKKYDRMNFV